jgi:hypothetical protein
MKPTVLLGAFALALAVIPSISHTAPAEPLSRNVIQNGMVKNYDTETMMEVLESLKVEAEEDEEIGGLVFEHNGWEGKVFGYNEDGEILDLGDEDATFCMMQVGKAIDEDDLDLTAINQFNWDSHWVRAYANDEEEVFLEMDIELSGGMTQANLKKLAQNFIESVDSAEAAFFGE